ncbi:hypothetical protein LTR17_022043 [Elasticomyces elasticus]|nr:hypothetical protein LTR17_022043 [Elasticomyces elasticus]
MFPMHIMRAFNRVPLDIDRPRIGVPGFERQDIVNHVLDVVDGPVQGIEAIDVAPFEVLIEPHQPAPADTFSNFASSGKQLMLAVYCICAALFKTAWFHTKAYLGRQLNNLAAFASPYLASAGDRVADYAAMMEAWIYGDGPATLGNYLYDFAGRVKEYLLDGLADMYLTALGKVDNEVVAAMLVAALIVATSYITVAVIYGAIKFVGAILMVVYYCVTWLLTLVFIDLPQLIFTIIYQIVCSVFSRIAGMVSAVYRRIRNTIDAVITRIGAWLFSIGTRASAYLGHAYTALCAGFIHVYIGLCLVTYRVRQFLHI